MKPSSITNCFKIACLFYALTSYSQECSTQENIKVTFFGYPDNSTPGPKLTISCGPRQLIAGGTGTYGDPVSFAAASDGVFKPCEIIYLPYLQKYARYEADCAQCKIEFDDDAKPHIDVWLGSSTVNGGSIQIACEDKLSPKLLQTIVRHPGQILKVDSRPLFKDGTCYIDRIYTSPNPSTLCLGTGIPGVPISPPTPPLPCLEMVTSIITVTEYPGSPATTTTAPSAQRSDSPPYLEPSASLSLTTTASQSSPTSSPQSPTPISPESPPTTISSTFSAAQTSAAACTWPGHCEGAECRDYFDCSDTLICTDGKCTPVD